MIAIKKLYLCRRKKLSSHEKRVSSYETILSPDEKSGSCHRLLYRTILEEARRLKIAGATVIKGIEGYATEVRGIDRRPVSLFTGVSNLPVLVTIVDQKENLEKLIPFLEKKATHALVLFEESTALVTDYMRQVIAKRQADGLEK